MPLEVFIALDNGCIINPNFKLDLEKSGNLKTLNLRRNKNRPLEVIKKKLKISLISFV